MQPLPPPPESAGQASKSVPSMSAGRDQREGQPTRPKLALAGSNNPDQQTEDGRTQSVSASQPKKRRHRGGKKRRNRRQSFAAPPSETSAIASNMDTFTGGGQAEDSDDHNAITPGESFYKRRHNRSDESLDSDVLLDHRYQAPMRPRRESRLNVQAVQRAGTNGPDRNHRRRRTGERSPDDDSGRDEPTDRTPLMLGTAQHRTPASKSGHGLFKPNTRDSSKSSSGRKRTKSSNMGQSFPMYTDSPAGHDVNNPPSVPGTPHMQASLPDPMMPDDSFLAHSLDSSRNVRSRPNGDSLIDIDRQELLDGESHSAPPSPRLGPNGNLQRHGRAMTFGADTDVCMPSEVMSEIADDDFVRSSSRDEDLYPRHRRKKEWPQLWVLDEWSREEKEGRANDSRRAQKIYEPVMIDGRLRPSRPSAWHREDAPNRYTYFNEEFESTIHAPTISELVPHDCTFKDLFIPEPPLLDDSSSSESEDEMPQEKSLPDGAKTTGMVSPQHDENGTAGTQPRSRSQEPSRLNSILTEAMRSESPMTEKPQSEGQSGDATPRTGKATKKQKPKKFGPRPTFWLDVLNPTDQEMHVLKKAFGIHPLTAEDIMMQEAREKVELFKNYYFINYRTFEQDPESEDYLEPVNVHIIVFRHGILTFHSSQIPHPANVRRRIRQLKDYLILSSDWISYAIIDDITDVFVPMIHNIEEEVDDIDEAILQSTPGAFSEKKEETGANKNEKDDQSDKASTFSLPLPFKDSGEKKKDTSGYDMLRRVGETRKKVMSLYRLLGTKADVIKGFAKRCNEQWDVAPKTEIGLYLGDIQDHILTMSSNLGHYETLLSRAHSNYLAQVSIRMNERGEQTGDILNKLTVFGTIVLPMNIICGMWGMNVKVPGQDIDNLWWFWGITGFLVAFAAGCYLLCRKLYGIV